MHWFKQNKLLFSHVSVSLDDPRLVGYVRGIRLFLFFILFCKPCFLVLRFIVKDGSYPHSSLREEGKQEQGKEREVEDSWKIKPCYNIHILNSCFVDFMDMDSSVVIAEGRDWRGLNVMEKTQ